MFHYIVKIEPKADHKLWIEYEDGESGVVSFCHVIELGGVFATLGQPSVFDQARIGDNGRFIEWPDNVDFCADALWENLKPAT
jgi:hypothetical protein